MSNIVLVTCWVRESYPAENVKKRLVSQHKQAFFIFYFYIMDKEQIIEVSKNMVKMNNFFIGKLNKEFEKKDINEWLIELYGKFLSDTRNYWEEITDIYAELTEFEIQ